MASAIEMIVDVAMEAARAAIRTELSVTEIKSELKKAEVVLQLNLRLRDQSIALVESLGMDTCLLKNTLIEEWRRANPASHYADDVVLKTLKL